MSLSDKIIDWNAGFETSEDNLMFNIRDVREAIKELKQEIEAITDVERHKNIFCTKIDEIFGDKLI